MTFELIGKTRAKILEVDPQQQKLGQTDMRPACLVVFKVSASNDVLNQFSPKLRTFLFEKSTKPATQQTLEGVKPVSDLNGLTDEGERIGSFGWRFEQSGSKLTIYQGVSGDGDIKLKDVTVDKVKFDNHDGGQVDITFNSYAADLDADIIGRIAVLTKHEVDIELEAPKVKVQKSLVPEGEGLTPLKAMVKGAAKPAAGAAAGWPFPTQDKDAPQVQITVKGAKGGKRAKPATPAKKVRLPARKRAPAAA